MYLLANAIGWIVSSFCLFHNVDPSSVLLDSVVTILLRSLAKNARHGISVIIFFSLLKSISSLLVQWHSDFFRSSCLFQLIFFESLGRDFAKYCIAPRNDFSSLHYVAGFNCKMNFIFSLFGLIPWSVSSCANQIVYLRKCFFFNCSVSGFLKFVE